MLTTSQSFKIYELLNKHFKNDEDSKFLVQEIENVITQRFEKEKSSLSTKEYIAKLETKIAESKTDMIKWTFSFFATLALMILGLYFRR